MNDDFLRIEPAEFERFVRETFRFLESDLAFACAGLRIDDSDPRDRGVSIGYRRNAVKVTVAMAEADWYFGIVVRLDSLNFSQADRYVYFEPFVQFVTDGAVSPLVPQQLRNKQFGRVLATRRRLFDRLGFDGVVREFGLRAKEFLPTLLSASDETIAAFKCWIRENG